MRIRRVLWPPLRYLLVSGATAMASWFAIAALIVSAVLVPLLPTVVGAVRDLVSFDRRRVGVAAKPYLPLTGSLGNRIGAAISDPATVRDVRWLVVHAFTGSLFGSLAAGLPGVVVQQMILPLIWWAVPGGVPSSFGLHVGSWATAALCLPLGAAAFALSWWGLPRLAALDARWSIALLAPPRSALTRRVAELTATRAAALEAHGAELRRIERDLHDGTQNRLVAVVMMLGMAERALQRDPRSAQAAVLRAQDAAGDALAELRDVVRSIHPPALRDLGLDGAVAALAARCPVPCVLEAGHLGRLPAAVEAAAYFTVAEALTNVAKHSGATQGRVRLDVEGDRLVVEVLDDGVGGADERGGTGLEGIGRRVAALDGTSGVTSPRGGPTVLRVVLPTGT